MFRDNVAHSNGKYGLRVYDVYKPYVGGCSGGEWAPAKFDGLLSYHNKGNGVTTAETGPLPFHRCGAAAVAAAAAVPRTTEGGAWPV